MRREETRSICTLLSQALVAFTIEFDNEAEHRLPHRTTRGLEQEREGTWLVSLAMYVHCLKHLPPEGLTVAELRKRARCDTNLPGMVRWGYIRTDLESQPKHANQFKQNTLLLPTKAGLRAKAVWEPLSEEIEGRWRQRWGADFMEGLRNVLELFVSRLTPELPDFLPILGYGLRCDGPDPSELVSKVHKVVEQGRLPLYTLLARPLLAFALLYESHSKLALAIGANVLRNLGENPVPIRNLPSLGGISKEACKMALTFLESNGMILLEQLPSPQRGKAASLTDEGLAARERYFDRLFSIEKSWFELAPEATEELQTILVAMSSDLKQGLEPYPDNWRANVAAPQVLPHFPMVLHRGGYPDGS